MELVDQLINNKALKSPSVVAAFKEIQRKDFVLPTNQTSANLDNPQQIGFGQTISQPSTVVFMLELCQPKEGEVVLDVGSGSGWTTALFSQLVGPSGRVYGIERINELKEFGEQNAEKYKLVSSGRATFVSGDGSKGLPEFAPYDIIHVGAAAGAIPEPLLKQLRIGGRLIIPVGIDEHELVLVRRISEKEYQEQRFPGFAFVPLIEKD
jgi:protein-L-isoaspartate(D-aspartate) O-methyltransferase